MSADQSKERILREATTEFALYGYNAASTNKIMLQAGLAKGLLFHHFFSKEELYSACLQKIIKEFQQELDIFMQEMSKDLFERLADFLTWKSRLAREKPITLRFLFGLSSLPVDIRSKADAQILILRKKNSKLLEDYDTSPWKAEIDQEKALAVIVMVFDAFDQKIIRLMSSEEPFDHKEMLSYTLSMLDVLKTGFYRSK